MVYFWDLFTFKKHKNGSEWVVWKAVFGAVSAVLAIFSFLEKLPPTDRDKKLRTAGPQLFASCYLLLASI